MTNESPDRARDVIKEYQKMAPGYDEGSENCGWGAPAELSNLLNNMGAFNNAAVIVDYAIGTGALSQELRKHAAQDTIIIGTDISPDMLKQADNKNIADVLVQQNITNQWGLATNSADLIASTGVSEYLNDEEINTVIEQASKTLKNGGRLAFSFLPDNEENNDSQQFTHKLDRLKTLFDKHGLQFQQSKEFEAYTDDTGQACYHTLIIGQKI